MLWTDTLTLTACNTIARFSKIISKPVIIFTLRCPSLSLCFLLVSIIKRKILWNYLEDGNCSISNSLAENCIRPFVIGRKNWLFSGSPKGAEASAGIYTLVETAKANGLAPMKYIKYILSDMPGSAFLEHPEYLDDYLPWNPLVKEFCR